MQSLAPPAAPDTHGGLDRERPRRRATWPYRLREGMESALLFWVDGVQAVGLPREYWFRDQEVSVSRLGEGIWLRPVRPRSVAMAVESEPLGPNTFFAGFLNREGRPATDAFSETLLDMLRSTAANDNDVLPAAPVADPVA